MNSKFLIVIMFSLFSFFDSKGQSKIITLFDQYSFLLQNSFKFLENNKSFRLNLGEYINNYKGYDFNNGRMEYVICHPFLLNNDNDKVIVPVLQRIFDLRGYRMENVKFVSARKQASGWEFKLKKGHVLTYAYGERKEIPTFSDQEIMLRVVKSFIEDGYMKINSLKIRDKYFDNTSWYVFNGVK